MPLPLVLQFRKYEKNPCFHRHIMGFHISLTLTIQREILTNINPTSGNIMLTNWTPIMVHLTKSLCMEQFLKKSGLFVMALSLSNGSVTCGKFKPETANQPSSQN